MGIDLGIKNITTTYDTADGEVRIYKGGKILSTQHHFNKQIQKLQKKLPGKEDGKTQQYSKNITKLHKKKARQIKHQLHCIAKDIVKTCEKKDIKTVVVGDLKNIRKKSNGKGKKPRKENKPKAPLMELLDADLALRVQTQKSRHCSELLPAFAGGFLFQRRDHHYSSISTGVNSDSPCPTLLYCYS